jgi:hypothetical protein
MLAIIYTKNLYCLDILKEGFLRYVLLRSTSVAHCRFEVTPVEMTKRIHSNGKSDSNNTKQS